MTTMWNRHFLGWDTPALHSASRWIVQAHLTESNELDLSSVHLVVPGKRAARILLGILVDHCDEHQIVMIPPVILTPLEIPSVLFGAPGIHASRTTSTLAWIQALQACPESLIECLIPDPPAPDRWDQWIGIGAWIAKLASELCDAGYRMRDVSPERVPDLEESEYERWASLGRVQENYEQILVDLGVVDDRLVAMQNAIGTDSVPMANRHFIFIGMPQLGSIARKCIERSQCKLDALIFAPDSHQEFFDEFGCVKTESWAHSNIDIDESRVQFQHDQASMCEHALAELASRANPLDTSTCVIGLADESLLGPLTRIASRCGQPPLPQGGIRIHSPSGEPASNTSPGQLLNRIRSHLQEQSFDTLSTLARHPNIEQAITSVWKDNPIDDTDPTEAPKRPQAWWIKSMDRIRQDHVQTGAVQIPSGVREDHSRDMQQVIDCIDKLLKPLLAPPQPLNQWTDPIAETLDLIYGSTELDPQSEHDQPVIEGLSAIRSGLDEINEAHQLGQVMPRVQAQEALGVILDRLDQIRLPDPVNRDAIETLGWLELALDPSPICVVIGMSEASIPESITHSPILPGSLRNTLGMLTNEDRFARDAYLLTAINASRDAIFCCPRMGDKNDPVAPSRLLLQTTGMTLAKRVQRFVTPSLDTTPNLKLHSSIQAGSTDQFRPPLTIDQHYRPPDSMTVTEFDAYLRSPAAWYMERKLKLNELDLTARELSPLLLGNIVHAVLDGFGSDPSIRDLDDAEKIHEAFRALLDHHTSAQFGSHPPAAIQIQTKLLSHRLEWFARHQASRRRQGWHIAHTEWTPPPETCPALVVDDHPMPLKGKVDRIDINDDGRVEVLDYKTGKITAAKSEHQSKDRWKKLQLPLYRHLVNPLFGDQPITLGYAAIPASENEPVWHLADWSDDELDAADNAARDIVREIRNLKPGQPVPMGEHPPSEGIMGFISGERFDSGGYDPSNDPELDEDNSEGES